MQASYVWPDEEHNKGGSLEDVNTSNRPSSVRGRCARRGSASRLHLRAPCPWRRAPPVGSITAIPGIGGAVGADLLHRSQPRAGKMLKGPLRSEPRPLGRSGARRPPPEPVTPGKDCLIANQRREAGSPATPRSRTRPPFREPRPISLRAAATLVKGMYSPNARVDLVVGRHTVRRMTPQRIPNAVVDVGRGPRSPGKQIAVGRRGGCQNREARRRA